MARFAGWMVGLWIGLAPVSASAQAPAPTAAEVKSWSSVQYMDHLVTIARRTASSVVALADNLPMTDDPAQIQAFLQRGAEVIHSGRAASAAVPPYKGDATLRDALVSFYDTVLMEILHASKQLVETVFQPRVTDATYSEAEALVRRIDDIEAKALTTLESAQQDFAKAHRIRLVDPGPGPQPQPVPTFSAPGVPPDGSALDANLHMLLTVTYHNQVVAHQERIVGAWDGLMQATAGDDAGVEPARLKALEQVRTARAAAAAEEAWRGDAGAREAVVELGDTMLVLLDGPAAEYAAIRAKGLTTRKRVDLANAAAGRAEQGAHDAINRFVSGVEAFQNRHQLGAYNAWMVQQMGAVAPE